MKSENYKLFVTSNAIDLAESVSSKVGMELGQLTTKSFADGEKFVCFDESIRGYKIFIVTRINLPYENLFELFLALDAARRASAKEIVVIAPYLPHSRQERKDEVRSAVAARLLANLLEEAGMDRLITVDLHNTCIEGFFQKPVDHLQARHLFIPHILTQFSPENICLCSPDFGAMKAIKQYKKELQCDMAVIHKERLKANEVAHMEIIGEVTGKDVILIDDMIDTAGTLCKAAELVMKSGAKSVSAYATHGIFSKNAVQRIEDSHLEKVFICDTLKVKTEHNSKISVITCVDLLAYAMRSLSYNKSLKDMIGAQV